MSFAMSQVKVMVLPYIFDQFLLRDVYLAICSVLKEESRHLDTDYVVLFHIIRSRTRKNCSVCFDRKRTKSVDNKGLNIELGSLNFSSDSTIDLS